MLDLFKKQFVFDGGVVTAGFTATGFDGTTAPSTEPVINIALYGEICGMGEDDPLVSRDIDVTAIRSMTQALTKAQDYTARLLSISREIDAA